jgi:cell wall-associated NlpC family hydrolase
MNAMLGVDGIRSRVAELASLVDPSSAPATTTDFASMLTAADASSALSAVDGSSGSQPSSLTALSSMLSGSSSGDGTDISGGTATAQGLVADAEKYLGVPYKWGGESLSEGGLDCSGLVLRSLTDLGVTGVPRTAKEQMSLGSPVSDLSAAKPGDLLIFHGGTHIAIYLGNNRMIEAPKAGSVVRETTVWATPTAIRRILPQAGATATATTTASAQRALLSLLSGASS